MNYPGSVYAVTLLVGAKGSRTFLCAAVPGK